MTPTTPLGRLLHDADGMRLEFVRTYDEPIDDVWAALTHPDRVARWFGRWTGDPASGRIELTGLRFTAARAYAAAERVNASPARTRGRGSPGAARWRP